MRISDWSSDVCSSDLQCVELGLLRPARQVAIQDQVADIQKIAVLRKLVDGIAAIQQLALVAIDIRNARFARSEEHTSELQSLMRISYAVFCLKKKKKKSEQTLKSQNK